MKRRLALVLATVALAVSLPTSAQSVRSPATLDALLRGFQGMPGLEASFEETKHVALLAAPLVQRGVFYFAPPGTLLKRVEGARAEEVLVTPTRVVRRHRGREEVIDLRARADVRPLVESMLWIFSGNRAELERAYRVTYAVEDGGAGFSLALAPRGEPLDRLIASMTIRGRGFAVTEVEVRETNGNRAVTRILAADPARRFGADERRRLFGER